MYLQGLKKTIACMDEELPRTNSSINNRADLRRILHLEGLYKKNKVSKSSVLKISRMLKKQRGHKMHLCLDRRTSLEVNVGDDGEGQNE